MPSPITLYQIAAGDHFELAVIEQGDITLGREPENGVVVDSVKVSRRHGVVIEAGSQWVYRDLGSTNGSWLNGLQLLADQPRLLRDSDLLQLGDIRLQVSIPESVETTASATRSLLLFSEQEFALEFGVPTDETTFTLGGENSSIEIEGVDHEELALVRVVGGGLEVVPSAGVTVLVNGMIVQEASSVADRDEITIGEFQIIVNDKASGHSRTFQRPGQTIPHQGSHHGAQPLDALSTVRASVLDQEGGTFRDDWESEAGRRKFASGRKFVFGQEGDEEAEPSVRGLGGRTPGANQQFEMNISQRLPSAGVVEEDPAQQRFSRIVISLGVVLMVLVIGLLAFVIYVAL